MKASPPMLSVIIVNYNAAPFLKACLTSLQTHLHHIDPEIIVVDNASCDGSLELIKNDFPWVQVISNSVNRGFSAAVNQGIRASQVRYLLWLNPDTELLDGKITEVITAMDHDPKRGICGLKILNSDGSIQFSGRAFPSYDASLFSRYSILTKLFPKNPWSVKYLNTGWDRQSQREVDWVSGAALLHKREVWDQLQGVDERYFMYCEDVDFCLQAKKAGWKTVYTPLTCVRHHIAGSSRKNPLKMIIEHHRSMWRYYSKNFSRFFLKDWLVASIILLRALCVWLTRFLSR